jgi:long-chain-fatty-acid---luciferin-component ligase
MSAMESAAELRSMFLHLQECFEQSERCKAIRRKLIEHAFALHFETNPGYRAYCQALGVNEPDGVRLADIPLLPSSLFKRRDVRTLSVEEAEIVKFCSSSGTLGSRSIVPRDEETLTRFLDSVAATLSALLGIDRAGAHRGLVLGPTTEEAGDLWFSYVIACLTVLMETEYFEVGGVFDPGKAASRLAEQIREGGQAILIGPPARILDVCRIAQATRDWPTFPSRSFVVSAGGWKGEAARAIDAREFRKEVAESLRIGSESQVRDSYNMVELNGVITECEAHEKHVPPWIEVQARDARTNELVADGELGVLGFLDASATSYPAFILSEDFGRVREGRCACGREGQRVQVVRRVNRVEARGCALKMAIGGELGSPQATRFHLSIYRRGASAHPGEE